MAYKYILGISAFFHDSSAVLLKNSEIIAAVQEERFTRIKFDNRFPKQSIKQCLEIGKIDIENIDIIAFYEDPNIKWDRIFYNFLHYEKFNFKNFKKLKNFLDKKFYVEAIIKQIYLKNFKGKIIFVNHHLSHASSSFYPSPFEKACVVTIDAIGEWSSTSIGIGDKNKIINLKEQKYPHSLGFLYSAFTEYLGFKVDCDEYKVMGLAPYGKPKYIEKIKKNLIYINEDGSFELNTHYFNFIKKNNMINKNFENLFGFSKKDKKESLETHHYDLAASIQKVLEEIFIKIVKYAIQITKENKVTLAGGVALNCVANGRLLNEKIVKDLWVQPAAGDAGGALGAALFVYYHHLNNKRENRINDTQKDSLLGPEFSNDEIKLTLERLHFKYRFVDNFDDICDFAVDEIKNGKVIGFFQNRMEFGPRALGSRSIIADPRNKNMQKILNLKIKFRESFRPFAPIVLTKYVNEWFENVDKSPYMLVTTKVKKEKLRALNNDEKEKQGLELLSVVRSEIPAITHVDNSARIQTVDEESSKRIYLLLKKFYEKTGCPILINTSFNIMNEPIVCTPADALNCYTKTNLDILIIGNYILNKNEN